ncbi:uncharacterized protein LOC133886840 [Phragmites australis]|uniref:uncharacterized protein LOC133886827 n=1 Tax=Phragmites australis TaxID=29695 RepID=UPI002D79EE16|nr:uncharacterized protein LOC133886827 [Phragmites australis]XP_062182697.1 uncharacterized protein LOC133886840 [Phragmites australis]
MALATALAKLLRGGRSGVSSSHLLPAIGRRMPQGGLAPLLPRLGSSRAAPAAGISRGINTESLPELDVMRKTYLHINGSFEPYNSKYIILDLEERMCKIGHHVQLYGRHWVYPAVTAGVVFVMVLTVMVGHRDQNDNEKTLIKFNQKLAKAQSDVEKLRVARNKSEKHQS